MTIKEIKQQFELEAIDRIPSLIDTFDQDPRKGVQQLCKRYSKKYKDYLEEKQRVDLLIEFDRVFQKDDEYLVAGIDEVGRGPLAGPVVAASVVLPYDIVLEGIDDSKQLTEIERNRLLDEIMEKALSVGIGIVDAEMIDQINILQATFRAMKKAVFSMKQFPDIILVDGNQTIPGINEDVTQHSVIGGDSKSISIAAASIIAKVTRDKIMVEYNDLYPEFHWDSNKGYGSPNHQWALREFGPTEFHRMSFLKNILRD